MNYNEIDWNKVWLDGRKKKSWRAKKNTVWDKRADSFARRNMKSVYVDRFLEILIPQQNMTILDFGSGPGTLTIPLAQKVKKVTAVDFSEKMIERLKKEAAHENLHNIEAIQGSWEDDWQQLGIHPHDVTIASRSLSVDDLQSALTKLNDWAIKSVFIADRVGAGPFDPELFKAIDREFNPGNDYIVTINLLYQMGIHARVDFITLDQPKLYSSAQDAIDSCTWMFEDLTNGELHKLESHITKRLKKNADGLLEMSKKQPTKWAVIAWDKN
jgi:hypothetical protein